MKLIDYIRRPWEKDQLINLQSQLIQNLKEGRAREQLQYARHLRDLIIQFRIALDEPDENIREDLEWAIRDLEDTVARAEEHVL